MLQNNQLAFIALANEYCSALESAGETMPGEFVASMLRLLPRIYISATDLRRSPEVTLCIIPIIHQQQDESVIYWNSLVF